MRRIAVVLVQLSGAAFTLVGLGGFLMGTVLPYRMPHSPLYMFLQFLVATAVVIVGGATILRFRFAAVAVAVCFLALCIQEAYGMSRGFDLPDSPHYSRISITVQALLGLIPAVLTAFAWPRLRSARHKPSNQALQPTAGRSDV